MIPDPENPGEKIEDNTAPRGIGDHPYGKSYGWDNIVALDYDTAIINADSFG
jgi:hypothetical protein